MKQPIMELPVPKSRPLRISLDVESVLANTFEHLLEEYNSRHGTDYVLCDISDWDWVRDEIDYEEFDSIVSEGWQAPLSNIPPTESGLASTVESLHTHPRLTVDIVTARVGSEKEMQTWLDEHSITQFRTFRAVDHCSKAELDYDLFIDDNPRLALHLGEAQAQYLIRGPHNQAAEDHPQTVPTPTVADAADHILNFVDGASAATDKTT